MHATALLKFANAFVLTNSPFTPFWAETMWQRYPQIRLGSPAKFVVKVRWHFFLLHPVITGSPLLFSIFSFVLFFCDCVFLTLLLLLLFRY